MSGTTVASGQSSAGLVISAGDTLDVLSGGTVTSPTVLAGGSELVSGGTDSSGIIDGGALTVDGLTSTSINFSTTILQAGTAIGTTVSSGGLVNVGPGGVTSGLDLLSTSGFPMDVSREDVDQGGVADGTVVDGGTQQSVFGGAVSGTVISAGGQQDLQNSATALNDIVYAGGGVTDDGTLAFSQPAGTSSSLAGSLSGSGLLVQSGGGTLALTGDASGFDGALVISGGTLELGSAAATSASIDFAGSATLLVNAAAPAGPISSFYSDDRIDLAGLAFSGASSAGVSGNTVTVTEGGVTETLTIAGASGDGGFTAASDGVSGTLLTDGITQVVVSAGHTLTISAGQTSSGVAVLAGGTLDVLYGGTAVQAQVQGVETLLGGADSGSTISSGGTLTVSAGGLASATVVAGSATVSSGGVASATTVSGTEQVYGGRAVSTTVVAGGALTVSGVTSNVSAVVQSGVASATMVQGGQIFVNTGGVSVDAVLLTVTAGPPGFTQESINGGTASGTIVNSGTQQNLFSGTASATLIRSGGVQSLGGAAVAVDDTVLGGGLVEGSGTLMFSEPPATSTALAGTLSGGLTVVQAGPGTLTLAGSAAGFTGRAVISGGTLELASAGAAGGAAIDFAGAATLLALGPGAPANTISGFYSNDGIDLVGVPFSGASSAAVSGDTVTVTEGGVVEALTIAGSGASQFTLQPDGAGGTLLTDNLTQLVVTSGQTLTISAGQTGSGILVQSGGTLDVASGGTAVSATVQGAENLLGTDSGGTVGSGGSLTVSAGGVALGGAIATGGTLTISAGGLASATVIVGSATVSSGGTLSGGTISGSATLDGGAATGAQVASGGQLSVNGQISLPSMSVTQPGTASQITVSAGGEIFVNQGGVTSGTVLLAPPASASFEFTAENVNFGGAASGTVLNSGTQQNVSGGQVSGSEISNGATQSLGGAAVALNDTVLSGGTVDDGATLLFTEAAGVSSSLAGTLSGSGLLVQSGPGTLVVSADAAGFTGRTVISGGTLVLASAGAAGTAGIAFAGAATLVVDGAGAPANTISALYDIDRIDLAGLPFSGTSSATVTGNAVTVTEGAVIETLTIASASNDGSFTAASDGAGGTVLTDSLTQAVVSSGATQTVSAGVTSSAVSVLSGGTLRVLSGGTATGALVQGTELVLGADSGGTVYSGGHATVSSGGTATGGTVSAGGTLTVLNSGAATGETVYGSAIVSRGTLSGGSLSGYAAVIGGTAGAVTVADGGTLVVSGTLSNGAVTHSGSALGTVVQDGGSITVAQGGQTSGTMLLAASSGLFGLQAQESVFGGTTTSTVVGSGAMQDVGGGTASFTVVQAGGTLSLTGVGSALDPAVAAGGTVDDFASLGFAEASGTVSALSGTLSGSGTLVQSGGGVLQLAAFAGGFTGPTLIGGGTLELTSLTLASAGAAGSGPIDLAGAAVTLQLDALAAPGNTISGMTPGDRIDFANTPFVTGDTASVTSGTQLQVALQQGTVSLQLAAGDYSADTFAVGADPSGGTLVTVDESAPCYCPGTLIQTPQGERPIEALAIGDWVATYFGPAERIRWLGRRSYAGATIAGNPLLLPVCVRAGALADAVPRRDLWLSPGHGLFIDGVLVPAWRLVNGRSVVQPPAMGLVHYLHVELAAHDIILAEGAPAESFLDDGCRGQFANAAEFQRDPAAAPARPCAKRVEAGFRLQAIQRQVAARAGLAPAVAAGGPLRGFVDRASPALVCGWAVDCSAPEVPVVLDVLAAGERVARLLANQYRADLRRAGIGSGCHAFDVALPPGLAGPVAVRRASDHAPLPLAQVRGTHPGALSAA
jgi:autotransporter-associated beta strand protein/autotransporter passenger strand-loop-strand repeat protein